MSRKVGQNMRQNLPAESSLSVLREGIRARGWEIVVEDAKGVVISRGAKERSYPGIVQAYDALTGAGRILARYLGQENNDE